jgi:hypothetical protein
VSLREPDPYPQPGDDVPGAPPPLRGTRTPAPIPAPPQNASPAVPGAGSYGGRIAAGAAAALAVLAVVAVVRRFRRRRG